MASIQNIIAALQDQRNSALDTVAQQQAELKELQGIIAGQQEKIKSLETQLAEKSDKLPPEDEPRDRGAALPS